MSWENIHVDDFGWVGRLTLQQDGSARDISSYTTREFIFRDPDGTETTKTASFDSDGTDGKLKYTILTGEVDSVGSWYVQARIAKAGAELTADRLGFAVKARLD